MDRRQSPRIKFAKNKPGFIIKLVVKRFFFKDRVILCTLRDISEGGASLQVTNEDKKYISEADSGKRVQLISSIEGPMANFTSGKSRRTACAIK